MAFRFSGVCSIGSLGIPNGHFGTDLREVHLTSGLVVNNVVIGTRSSALHRDNVL